MFSKSFQEIYKIFESLLLKTSNIDIIQSIVYGFGIIGLKAPNNLFASVAKPIVAVINLLF